jgi:predicted dehydrogenase
MAVRMLRDGAIGKVSEIHAWVNTSFPFRGRPAGNDPVPDSLDWDRWLGVAPSRPFKEKIYHDFNWRGWQDFGSGSLGDMACHIFDPVFTALEIGAPSSVKAETSSNNHENWPAWQILEYEFPGTKYTVGNTVKGYWYDGGKMPPEQFAPIFESRRELPRGGSLIVGEEGTMFLPHIEAPQLYPLEKFSTYTRPRLEAVDHYLQFVEACRGNGKTTVPFDYAGPLTEAVQLGNIAVRVPDKSLQFDAANLRITNDPAAHQLLRRNYREGWKFEGLS